MVALHIIMMKSRTQNVKLLYLFLVLFAVTACRQDMHDQPRYKPLAHSDFFVDGQASRTLIPGTIARGHLRLDEHLYQGKVNGELATTFPFPITREVLERGQQRFNIYCSPCHDKTGSGQGMIVQRGLRPPPSFHIERLRNSPPGHFFDVITNGLGAMYDYKERVKVEDRWAIVAYIQALQLSQNVTVEEIPEDIRQHLP